MFRDVLDPRRAEDFVPKRITGTGKISEKTMWISVADRCMRNF